MWWLVKTVSTRYSEIGSRCNEQARVGDFLMLRLVAVASLAVATVSLKFAAATLSLAVVSNHFLVTVELLCWYVNICLVRIDSYDDGMYIVHVGTLAQAYTWDIANESLSCDMMPKYWVICEMNWLIATPRRWVARDWVAWQTRSARLGHQVMQGHDIGLLGPTCWVISV